MDWSDTGIEGCQRFLARLWRLVDRIAELDAVRTAEEPAVDGHSEAARALRRKTHDTIRRVTVDIEERVHLNTAVAAIMELVNEVQSTLPEEGVAPSERGLAYAIREAIESLPLLLVPFAPHLSSEAWARLGKTSDAVRETWPSFQLSSCSC